MKKLASIKHKADAVVKPQTSGAEDYPPHILAGIRKGQQQVANGEVKSYEEVEKILAKRWP
jgi:hypothetical protein